MTTVAVFHSIKCYACNGHKISFPCHLCNDDGILQFKVVINNSILELVKISKPEPKTIKTDDCYTCLGSGFYNEKTKITCFSCFGTGKDMIVKN